MHSAKNTKSGLPHSNQDKIPCVFPVISLCSELFPCVFLAPNSIYSTTIKERLLALNRDMSPVINSTTLIITSFHFPSKPTQNLLQKSRHHRDISLQPWYNI